MGIVAITEIILFIIGSLMGFLNAGIIVAIVVMGIILIALWVRNLFSSGSEGGV